MLRAVPVAWDASRAFRLNNGARNRRRDRSVRRLGCPSQPSGGRRTLTSRCRSSSGSSSWSRCMARHAASITGCLRARLPHARAHTVQTRRTCAQSDDENTVKAVSMTRASSSSGGIDYDIWVSTWGRVIEINGQSVDDQHSRVRSPRCGPGRGVRGPATDARRAGARRATVRRTIRSDRSTPSRPSRSSR